MDIGMPDFVVLRIDGNIPLGIVESKGIKNRLSQTEKTEQVKRYMAYGNLILTNYLEFRWYADGEKRDTVRIARLAKGKIQRIQKNYRQLTDLLQRFLEHRPSNINSAQELAQRLARQARLIAHFIEKDLKSNSPSQNLVNQRKAFQETLIPDLDEKRFADMFAQTLVYGLFAARINHLGDPKIFSLTGAAQAIPQTNPFLRRLFYQNSFDLGSRLTWLVEGVVEILRHSDIDSILEHFGRRTQQIDPVIHFYETFLAAYDPKLREQRGVYYTPEPVVKYIVRSVDHILKTRFDRPDGLADKDTLILDPAAGTGTFLYHVIEQIRDQRGGQAGSWKQYVSERLLPRIFGFELLMAPYTIAHMKLSMQLKEEGYAFKEGERLGIYLTNALEEAVEAPPLPFAQFIAEEANTAAEIKRDKPIMVVLGNPPYSYQSQNKGKWITGLTRDYYTVDGQPLGERNPKGLSDDYVKFIRFAQWRVTLTGEGILAFITNHTYLDGPTFRGMRQSLLDTFDSLWIVNLHGNSKRSAVAPDGNRDENVFDIQQGVSIILLVKEGNGTGRGQVQYLDLWGSRAEKYLWLESRSLHDANWQLLKPAAPQVAFVPRDNRSRSEYEAYMSITDIMPVNVRGFITSRDSFALADKEEQMMGRIVGMRSQDISDSQLQERYSLRDSSGWRLSEARVAIRNDPHWKHRITLCDYRPFDKKFCFFSSAIMERPRREIAQHVVGKDNLSLLTTRQQIVSGFRHVWCSNAPAECCVISGRTREGNQVLPVYLYPTEQQELTDVDEFPLSDKGRRPNLSKAFVEQMEAKLGLPFQTEGSAFATNDRADWFGPEDVFYYAYAVFHSPTYRERYAEFLKIDFPRLPLTSDVALFGQLVKLGAELVGLHLMKSTKLKTYMTTFEVEDSDEVAAAHPKYVEKGGRVYINRTQYFGGVPQEVWEFHIGGYQVAHKWLKDRKGRKLSLDDINHYQKIVVALSETIRLMSAIDAAIPGFPLT